MGKIAICLIVGTTTRYAAFVPVKPMGPAHKIAEMVLAYWMLNGLGIPHQAILRTETLKFTSRL